MTIAFHERIDIMRRSDRCKLYYFVGITACIIAYLLDARIAYAAALVVLGLAAAFLLVRLIRELRPDRMALPPELRVVLRKPRSE